MVTLDARSRSENRENYANGKQVLADTRGAVDRQHLYTAPEWSREAGPSLKMKI